MKFNKVIKARQTTSANMLNFPELRQTYGYDCGAKATEAVLAYFGMDIREDLIMKKLTPPKEARQLTGL